MYFTIDISSVSTSNKLITRLECLEDKYDRVYLLIEVDVEKSGLKNLKYSIMSVSHSLIISLSLSLPSSLFLWTEIRVIVIILN